MMQGPLQGVGLGIAILQQLNSHLLSKENGVHWQDGKQGREANDFISCGKKE